MKDMLVSSFYYTNVSHLLDFNINNIVSFDIKYFFCLLDLDFYDNCQDWTQILLFF